MNDQSTSPTPDANAINEHVKMAVNSHRIKLRVLTTAAFVFGFLALITGFVITWIYPIRVLPKQRELVQRAETLLVYYRTNDVAAARGNEVGKEIGQLLAVEVMVGNVTTAGTAIVALAVGLLAFGTLLLLTVVILSRRVALNQINASLAQISGQLRELQNARGSP